MECPNFPLLAGEIVHWRYFLHSDSLHLELIVDLMYCLNQHQNPPFDDIVFLGVDPQTALHQGRR